MLSRLLLDTKNSQKWATTAKKKVFFLPDGEKKSLDRSPPQEIEVGPRSGPYLLVTDLYKTYKLTSSVNL